MVKALSKVTVSVWTVFLNRINTKDLVKACRPHVDNTRFSFSLRWLGGFALGFFNVRRTLVWPPNLNIFIPNTLDGFKIKKEHKVS